MGGDIAAIGASLRTAADLQYGHEKKNKGGSHFSHGVLKYTMSVVAWILTNSPIFLIPSMEFQGTRIWRHGHSQEFVPLQVMRPMRFPAFKHTFLYGEDVSFFLLFSFSLMVSHLRFAFPAIRLEFSISPAYEWIACALSTFKSSNHQAWICHPPTPKKEEENKCMSNAVRVQTTLTRSTFSSFFPVICRFAIRVWLKNFS